MAIHQVDRTVFLVEYPGLPREPQDVTRLLGAESGGETTDSAFGANLRRLLYASMEATAEAKWVRERGCAVRLAPTEPHRGKLVFRLTFADEDEAMLFALTWTNVEPAAAPRRKKLRARRS